MPTSEVKDLRSDYLQGLMDRVREETYPSVTMLNLIESLLEPDEVPDYVEHLLERVRADTYPSIDMLNRIHRWV